MRSSPSPFLDVGNVYKAQAFKESRTLRAEDPRRTIYYKLPPETTTLEGIRHYEAELKAKGYERLLYKLTGADVAIYVSLYAFAINNYSGIGAESQKLKGVEVGRVLLRVDVLREGR